MYALCQFVREYPPRRISLFGRLQPAFLLHWSVQAHLVSRLGPDLLRDNRELWVQEMVGGHPLSQYAMCRPLPPPALVPCPEDWDAPNSPVLGSICLEEPTNREEDDGAQTPPESLCLEEPEDSEDDERAPTPHEEEPVGALEPWDPWAAGRAEGVEFPPEYPCPPPVTGTGGYLTVDYPRGYAWARRINILILEEW